MSRDGKDYILEIKTVKNVDLWRGEIPANYLWQVYLYNHFITRQDRAYIGVGVVDNGTYENPDNWQPNSRNCILAEVPIDQDMVAAEIERMREVRGELVRTLTTIPMNPAEKADCDLMTHLHDYNAGKDELIALCEETSRMSQELQDIKSSYRRMEVDLESKKARLKDLMLYHGITGIGNITMRIQNRVSYDYASMERDGLDIAPYRAITEVPTIIVKTAKGGQRHGRGGPHTGDPAEMRRVRIGRSGQDVLTGPRRQVGGQGRDIERHHRVHLVDLQ